MKKSSTSFRFSSLLFFFFFIVAASINVVYSEDAASIVINSEDPACTYFLTVLTGTVAEAETDSLISVTLGNSAGERLKILDLKKWGTMPPNHNYFMNGNQDSFRAKADCFDTPAPVCNITVTSDGSGHNPGWFLEHVEVIAHVPDIANRPKIDFVFNQWLANDEPPYKLTPSRNEC